MNIESEIKNKHTNKPTRMEPRFILGGFPLESHVCGGILAHASPKLTQFMLTVLHKTSFNVFQRPFFPK